MNKLLKQIIGWTFTIIKYYFLFLSLFIVVFNLAILILDHFHVIDQTHFNWFYELMSHSCHQGQFRSLTLFSLPFAVCSRCLGIYIGTSYGFFKTRKLCFTWYYLLLGFGFILLGLIEKYLELNGLLKFNTILGLISGLFLGYGLIFIANLLSSVKLLKEKKP
jgi:uncharacterized membrane protein